MTKIIFADLDSTLIETKTGRDFPISILDFKPIWKVWKYLKSNLGNGDYLFIVSNQGGISKGYLKEEYFLSKIRFICSALNEYIKKNITVDSLYCADLKEDSINRKPNTGMLSTLINKYNLTEIPKLSMLMIGDASGKPNDFSDSDLMTAKNFGINYIDVDEIRDI